MGFNHKLPDGRVVDICTEIGANAFLQSESEFLSVCVEAMSNICSYRKMNARDKNDLMQTAFLFSAIAKYGDRQIFRQSVEQSTVRAWLDFVIAQFRRFTTNPNWIAIGSLPMHDLRILEGCVFMMNHAVAAAFAFEGEFFTALADCVKARKGTGRALPSEQICYFLTLTVSNAYQASRLSFDNTWTSEQAFKKLEATGALEQFFRCVSVPQAQDDWYLFGMLDELQACIPFIKKKLQPGQPCGDAIIAILDGKDGSRAERPSLLSKLRAITRIQSSVASGRAIASYNSCRKCGKADSSESFQKSLMQCARCKQTWYCSKECQRADWKVHKKTCAPTSKKGLVMVENMKNIVNTFCMDHYIHIMVKMAKACEDSGLSTKDVLVQLDYIPDRNGIVPAMQEKPDFKISPLKDFVEGPPTWLSNDDLDGIKAQHQSLKQDRFLFFIRFDGGITCSQLARCDPFTKKDTFTQVAVDAFQDYLNDHDDELLCEVFEPRYLLLIKKTLQTDYGHEMTEEQMMKDAMNCLRLYGAPPGLGL